MTVRPLVGPPGGDEAVLVGERDQRGAVVAVELAQENISVNAWDAVTRIAIDGTFLCSTEFARRLIACRNVIADYLKRCDFSLKIGYWTHVVSLAIEVRERSPRDFRPDGAAHPHRYRFESLHLRCSGFG